MGPQVSTSQVDISEQVLRSHDAPTRAARRLIRVWINEHNPPEEIQDEVEGNWSALSHEVLLTKLRLLSTCSREIDTGALSSESLDLLADMLQDESTLREKYFQPIRGQRLEFHEETQASDSFGSIPDSSTDSLFSAEIPVPQNSMSGVFLYHGYSEQVVLDSPIPVADRSEQDDDDSAPAPSKVTIDVLLMEKAESSAQSQTLRTFFSPYYLRDPANTDVDVEFTLALRIGPWIFTWDESSLCLPRRALMYLGDRTPNTAPLLSHYYYRLDWTEELRDRLIQWIRYWNTSMVYCEDKRRFSARERRFRGNSWDFVFDGINTIFEGHPPKPHLGSSTTGVIDNRFINEIRETGSCRLSFTPSRELLADDRYDEFWSSHSFPKTFSTHLELDEFMMSMLTVEDMFDRRFQEDYLLLKSFDRWLLWKWYRLNPRTLNDGVLEVEEEEEETEIDPLIQTNLRPFHSDGQMYCPFGELSIYYEFAPIPRPDHPPPPGSYSPFVDGFVDGGPTKKKKPKPKPKPKRRKRRERRQRSAKAPRYNHSPPAKPNANEIRVQLSTFGLFMKMLVLDPSNATVEAIRSEATTALPESLQRSKRVSSDLGIVYLHLHDFTRGTEDADGSLSPPFLLEDGPKLSDFGVHHFPEIHVAVEGSLDVVFTVTIGERVKYLRSVVMCDVTTPTLRQIAAEKMNEIADDGFGLCELARKENIELIVEDENGTILDCSTTLSSLLSEDFSSLEFVKSNLRLRVRRICSGNELTIVWVDSESDRSQALKTLSSVSSESNLVSVTTAEECLEALSSRSGLVSVSSVIVTLPSVPDDEPSFSPHELARSIQSLAKEEELSLRYHRPLLVLVVIDNRLVGDRAVLEEAEDAGFDLIVNGRDLENAVGRIDAAIASRKDWDVPSNAGFPEIVQF